MVSCDMATLASARDSSQILAMRRTTALYRACMSLASEGSLLALENEGMKRLGLNAQVMAVHTGTRGGSLEVLVAEISRLSTSIREILGLLASSAFILNEKSVRILHMSHLNASYSAGWEIGIVDINRDLYHRAYSSNRERLGANLSELEQQLMLATRHLDDLTRIAQQIPPISSLIRIVVAEIRMKTDELLGTVADLTNFHQLLEGKIERMREVRGHALARIDEMREDHR
jgi:hypothetical protein